MLHRALLGCFLALIFASAVADDASKLPRIGVLMPPVATASIEKGLRTGLQELGYIEDKSIAIIWRRSAGSESELMRIAEDMAHQGAQVIVTPGTPATRAALKATSVPIVFEVGDPVAAGFAATLAKPGGRATGVSALATELYPKRLELLRQLVPRARRIAYLRNAENPMAPIMLREMNAAAQRFGLALDPLAARDGPQIDAALHMLQQHPPDGLVVSAELNLLERKVQLARVVRATKIPTVFPWREYHDEGVVLSYGASLQDLMRRTATYVDRILRGEEPGELPVEQVSKFELVVNLKTAKALGITIPESILLRADEVIR